LASGDGCTAGYQGGGINYGTIQSDVYDGYGETTDIFFGLGGVKGGIGWTFMPGTQFIGGFVKPSGDFTIKAECGGFLTGACYTAGLWNISTGSDLVIPNFQSYQTGVLHVPAGINVILQNAYLTGGVFDGAGSVWVNNGSFDSLLESTYNYFNIANFYINGTFWTNLNDFSIVNNHSLTITQNGNVTITSSNSNSGTSSGSQIVNNGLITINYQGISDISLTTPILNQGKIAFRNTASSSNKGIAGYFKMTAPLAQSSNGTIIFNVYSTSDYDAINYQTMSLSCPIQGNVQVNFLYTPNTGDYVDILTYQQGTGSSRPLCYGYFTATATGLSSGQTLSIWYDLKSPDGYSDYVARAYVCSSANETCTMARSASGAPITTTGSTTGSGSGPTTGSTGGTSSSSDASLITVSSAIIFTSLLLFLL